MKLARVDFREAVAAPNADRGRVGYLQTHNADHRASYVPDLELVEGCIRSGTKLYPMTMVRDMTCYDENEDEDDDEEAQPVAVKQKELSKGLFAR